MTADESHRQRARRTIKAAKLGFLPKPNSTSLAQPPVSGSNISLTNEHNNRATSSSTNHNPQDPYRTPETSQLKSIEVYDSEKFSRNSILTRSARVRKFKFYQYKPIETSPTTTTTTTTPKLDEAILSPREEVLEGRVEQESAELVELEEQIEELDKKIADLNKINSNPNNTCNLNEIFQLVNKKNDLLRRQMQLNILEQEKVLEKANEELVKELRSLMSIEDGNKTQAQLDRQQYLYDKYLSLVDRRNELVLHLDVQEKGIEDDQAMKKRLTEVLSSSAIGQKQRGFRTQTNTSGDQNCCIQ